MYYRIVRLSDFLNASASASYYYPTCHQSIYADNAVRIARITCAAHTNVLSRYLPDLVSNRRPCHLDPSIFWPCGLPGGD